MKDAHYGRPSDKYKDCEKCIMWARQVLKDNGNNDIKFYAMINNKKEYINHEILQPEKDS